MRLIEDAIDNVDPLKISTPKGYEQMSCFEGLCELYRATGQMLLGCSGQLGKKF